jgi:hypothetical protein
MLTFRSVQQGNHCAREEFLYELKAGPAGGRLRRPSSAARAATRIFLHRCFAIGWPPAVTHYARK